jgi:hypothetical protein
MGLGEPVQFSQEGRYWNPELGGETDRMGKAEIECHHLEAQYKKGESVLK